MQLHILALEGKDHDDLHFVDEGHAMRMTAFINKSSAMCQNNHSTTSSYRASKYSPTSSMSLDAYSGERNVLEFIAKSPHHSLEGGTFEWQHDGWDKRLLHRWKNPDSNNRRHESVYVYTL
jgi:hypothetical protein